MPRGGRHLVALSNYWLSESVIGDVQDWVRWESLLAAAVKCPRGESSPCVSDPCELGTSATGLGA